MSKVTKRIVLFVALLMAFLFFGGARVSFAYESLTEEQMASAQVVQAGDLLAYTDKLDQKIYRLNMPVKDWMAVQVSASTMVTVDIYKSDGSYYQGGVARFDGWGYANHFCSYGCMEGDNYIVISPYAAYPEWISYSIRFGTGIPLSLEKYSQTPKQPTSVNISDSDGGAKITWQASENADGYYVYKRNNSGSLVKIAELSGNDSTLYTDKTHSKGTVDAYAFGAYRLYQGQRLESNTTPSVMVNCQLEESMFSVDTSNCVYSGKEIEPTVWSNSLKNKDYSVGYSNNINAGTAKILIIGKGSFCGSLTYEFTINKAEPVYTEPTNVTGYVGQKLSEIGLPIGFSWKEPDTVLKSSGLDHFWTIFTPSDTANYETAEVWVTVTVNDKSFITDTMYRLYNKFTGDHLFTTDENEYDSLVKGGWKGEGQVWIAPKSNTGDQPVYRLYNPYSGDHHYTKSLNEYNELQKLGWNGEDVKFYSAGESGEPIFRLFNPWLKVGTHLYTKDKSEYENLSTLGWQKEGISFYGVS